MRLFFYRLAMKKIGKYTILKEIGHGGMGAVYKAHDPLIDREVAIKVILEKGLDAPEIKQRFYREARSAGKLSHENITIVHDVGEADGKPYIVMEYLQGADLRFIINKKISLTLDQKIDYAVQICRGLQFAHSKNIIHRDIKPENMMILEDGKVKIMDFGIAKPESGTLTRPGTMVGTPHYMSPEQIKGQKVDKRSDIFSFGVLFYELLAYKRPFIGENANSVMYQIVYEPPQKLSIEGSDVVNDLQKIVSQCLEKGVNSRYDDFANVIGDLNNVINKEKYREKTTASPARTKISFKTALWMALPVVVMIGILSGWLFLSNIRKGEADKNFAAAKQAYDSAGYHFRKSLDEAKTAASIAQAGLDKLKEDVEAAKSEMLKAKLEAEKAEAGTKAPQLYENALRKEQEGDRNCAAGDRDGLGAALKAYTDAADGYKKALEETKSIASSAAIARLREGAESAKKEMANVKRLVGENQNEKMAEPQYQRALEIENAGEQQFASGDFRAARRSFQSAKDFFLTASRNIINVLKSRAGEAKAAMKAAKDKLGEDNYAAGKYQQALKIETEGDKAQSENDFAKAGERYQAARLLFVEIATEAGRKNETSEQAIGKVIAKYKTSLERGSIQGLRALYKNFTRAEEEKWSNMFKYARDRKVNIAVENAKVRGNSAAVNLLVRILYSDNKNRERELNYAYTWTLEPINGQWIISSFVVR